MPSFPFAPLFALVSGRGAALYGAALALLALPLPVFFAAFAAALMRRRAFGWFLMFSDFCGYAFLALLLFGERGREALLPALCAALAAKAVYLACFGALCLPQACRARAARLRQKKRARAARLAEEEEGQCPSARSVSSAERAAPAAPPPDLPPKVRCFEEGEVRVERDVRLGHISQALSRLQAAPLTAGDRLEAQAAQELLSVYAGKGALRTEEAESLNDVMASLLKMMARYDL